MHEVDEDFLDLTDTAATEAFFAEVGPPQILVNVAGGVCGQTHTPIDELSGEHWDTIVDADLRTGLHLHPGPMGRLRVEGQHQLWTSIATRRTGTPADVACGGRFFESPAADRFSGQTLSIDGRHSLF